MAIGVAQRDKGDNNKKPTRYYSNKQEKSVARALGGKQTANSGATDFGGKSDVSVANLISIECKTKMSPSESISIRKDWFEKMTREKVSDGHKYSILAFNFGPEEEMHYVIDEDTFIDFVEYLKQVNGRE